MPSIMETNGVVRLMMVKIMVPMILNIRWMMVVRLALRPCADSGQHCGDTGTDVLSEQDEHCA